MLKSNIDRFVVTSFLCSLPFLLFRRIEYPKTCLWNFVLWISFCDMTIHVPSKSNVPFLWIEYNPISIMYTFYIDISSNSREIKYQNIGRIHRHTHRQTHIRTYAQARRRTRTHAHTHTHIHTHTHTCAQTDSVKTIPPSPQNPKVC